jgi:hypothetical protein
MFASTELMAKRRREFDAHEAEWLRELYEYDQSGDWAIDKFQSTASAVRHMCHMTPAVAAANVSLARKLAQLHTVSEAFAAGDISAKHAQVIADAFTPKRAAAMAEFEEVLVDVACNAAPDELFRAVQRITGAIDGDGGAATDEEKFARRRYHASGILDGMTKVDGLFDAESAAIQEASIDAEMERDFRANDPRTPQQRRADAETNIHRQALNHGMIGSSRAVRPHLSEVIHLDQLSGVNVDLIELIRRERRTQSRLSRATLDRLRCDADISRIIMIGDSEILDVGRAQRTVTPAQWKALVVRDGQCQHPRCNQPPHRCEAHHQRYWEHDGPTDLDNLELLCWFHHREKHQHDDHCRSRGG